MTDPDKFALYLEAGHLCSPDPCKIRTPNSCTCSAIAAQIKELQSKLDQAKKLLNETIEAECDLQSRLDSARKTLERIADVAERYQENASTKACAGLANVLRFAKHELEKKQGD